MRKNAGSPTHQHWTQLFQAESNAKAISVLESVGNLKSDTRAGNQKLVLNQQLI